MNGRGCQQVDVLIEPKAMEVTVTRPGKLELELDSICILCKSWDKWWDHYVDKHAVTHRPPPPRHIAPLPPTNVRAPLCLLLSVLTVLPPPESQINAILQQPIFQYSEWSFQSVSPDGPFRVCPLPTLMFLFKEFYSCRSSMMEESYNKCIRWATTEPAAKSSDHKETLPSDIWTPMRHYFCQEVKLEFDALDQLLVDQK